MNKVEKKRNVKLDYLRIFACLSVILIHIFATARTTFPNHSVNEELLSITFTYCLHYAVPIFFMITGTLFLNKDIKNFNVFKYVKKYLLVILVFGWSFAIFEEIFNKNVTLIMPFSALLNVLQMKTWDHMWYLYELIGVMLTIPILLVLKEKDEKYLNYILYILLLSSFIIPLLDILFGITIGFNFPFKSQYLTCLIIGYFLNKNNVKISTSYYILGIIISEIIIVLLVFNSEMIGLEMVKFLAGYSSIIVLFIAVCLFKLFNNSKIAKENNFVTELSNCTFGMYLMHMFWINLIYKLIKFNIYDNYLIVNVLIVYVSVVLLSFVTVFIMRKIPLLNRLV